MSGIRPHTDINLGDQVVVGAVGGDQGDGHETDAEIEQLAEGLEDFIEGDDGGVGVHDGVAGAGSQEDSGGEEGLEPVVRNAPTKPDQSEIDRHFTTHVPRRLWCPICAQATLEEDPHRRSAEDHVENGLPMICIDYKELVKGRPVHIVMRERATGRTYGVRCKRKGAGDEWIVQRLVARLNEWGLKECQLWVKSDCEPAIRALQVAVRDARGAGTHISNSPPRDTQSNGVAERTVRE